MNALGQSFNFETEEYFKQPRAMFQEDKTELGIMDLEKYQHLQNNMTKTYLTDIRHRNKLQQDLFKELNQYNEYQLSVTKKFEFESAHYLPFHDGKCRALHGHSYKLEVTVKGSLDEHGFVIDFSKLKKMVNEEIIDVFDHNFLNQFIYLPTCENTLLLIWDKLSIRLADYAMENKRMIELTKLKLYEQSDSFAVLTKEDLGL